MATVPLVGEERIVLRSVSWAAYEALVESWRDLPTRLTYDRGVLEIMSPLLSHEQYGSLIAQFVEVFTLERRIPRHTGGSTTFRQAAKERGLEPDECYWIQNEPRMRSRKEFDPDTDPPPDLAIEVDISSSSLDRMSIYADLGVPEVWRFDGRTFTIHVLRQGAYLVSDTGLALPELTSEVVTRFLKRSDEVGETDLLVEFLAWARLRPKRPGPSRKRRPPRK